MLRALLCDLDDTLFDHTRGTRLALAEVRDQEPAFAVWSLDEFDTRHRIVLEEWHQLVLHGLASIDAARVGRFAELLAAAGADRPEARAVDVAAIYRRQYSTAWHPVAGAPELLAAVKAAGLRIAIVTNNVVVEQRLKLAHCGLEPYVDALVTSEEIGAQKPDVAIFNAALARGRGSIRGRDARRRLAGGCRRRPRGGRASGVVQPVGGHESRSVSDRAGVA